MLNLTLPSIDATILEFVRTIYGGTALWLSRLVVFLVHFLFVRT